VNGPWLLESAVISLSTGVNSRALGRAGHSWQKKIMGA
jgi:hypothetical protein